LRTEAALCGSLDYAAVEKADFEGRVSMRVTRPGAAHGLCAWFDTTLAPGIGFTNAPGAPPTVYGQAYFPWPEAVELGAGHVVEASIGARLLGDDYTWAWETRVLDPAGRTLCRFRQSNFAGEPLSSDTLRRRSASHVPVLGEEARADALALGMMDQGMALGDVARELAARFPGRFRRWEDALAHAGDLSLKYGR
jgi:protein arginine N-methyltransferase 1